VSVSCLQARCGEATAPPSAAASLALGSMWSGSADQCPFARLDPGGLLLRRVAELGLPRQREATSLKLFGLGGFYPPWSLHLTYPNHIDWRTAPSALHSDLVSLSL
jgi:hypothetical protein